MKILPVEAELFHADGRTDRLTDMSKVIVAFRNFAKVIRKTPQPFPGMPAYLAESCMTKCNHFFPASRVQT
jgi:hypothetical protein